MWRMGLWTVLAAVLMLAAVLGGRTLYYSTLQTPGVEAPAAVTISPAAVERLSRAVQIPTLSSLADDSERQARFQAFRAFLKQSFPRVHAQLQLERFNDAALLFTWPGRDADLAPVLLLSHQDVVPVESGTDSSWRYPPFSGRIAEGYVWGRGAWDDKSTLMASLEALEMLLREVAAPQRTLMLAFGHDEEVGGEQGAAAVAAALSARGQQFAFILDEGGVIGEGLVPGVNQPVAMIATAEKGYLTLELSAQGAGGHSSAPPRMTAAGRVARAVARLQAQPLPAALTPPVRDMLVALTPHMSWPQRVGLSNLWLFEPWLVWRLAAEPATQAYVRTTTAPTMLRAGVKENVLPQSAQATVNFRILPGQRRAGVIGLVREVIADDKVEVREAGAIGSEPSATASPEGYGYREVARAVRQVNPDVLVAPMLLFGATDSRHYAGLSKQILRFTPIRVGRADIRRIHGTNERIAIEDYERAVRFYYQLLSNTVINPQTQAK